MLAQCGKNALDSPLFQRKHCKTEGLCNFPRCVERNCFRCMCCLRCVMSRNYAFLWRCRSRREVCRCVTVEPSSRTTTTIPPTITTVKTITTRCSLRAWLAVASSQTKTLPTPQSQFQTQKKCQPQGISLHEVGQMWRTAYWHLEKRCRQRKGRKRRTSVRLA